MGKTHKTTRHDTKESRNDRAQWKNSKKNKKRDTSDAQLAELLKEDGFEIHYMIGDGNCLFRSVAHQLVGDPNRHPDFRAKVIRYMRKNQGHFSLFLEDDENFSDYIERMEVIGEWGGHLELYALTQCCNVTIVIHQLDSPNYKLPAANPNCKTEIHLSYHGECHYNSVKRFNDLSMGVSGWSIEELDELGSSTVSNISSSTSKRKGLSVASVATVTTRNGSKDKNKVGGKVKATSTSSAASIDIVTYESVRDDYVLVSVDHNTPPPSSSPASSTLTTTITPTAASSEHTNEHLAAATFGSVLASGLEYVCSTMEALSMGVVGTVVTEEPEHEGETETQPPAAVDSEKKQTKFSSNDVILTKSGRPMSKKERRQYEKQMLSKGKGSVGGPAVLVKQMTAEETTTDDDRDATTASGAGMKKEIIL